MHTTEAILERFEKINAIPRRSKNEKRLTDWLSDWATGEGYLPVRDGAGNLIVRVPGSSGREEEPIVILQGHMDMVCEKHPDSNHDFSADPIRTRVEGEWLKAEGTTLGADNGIALAIAMHAATELSHPPLELLFTADEETGLTGARNLDASLLSGRVLINLDSEDEGVVTIGCAGGRDAVLKLPVAEDELSAGVEAVKLSVTGLSGGHSGVDIDQQLGNANKILARTLDEILRSEFADEIIGFGELEAGSARNAIPRDASIELLVPRGAETARLVGLIELVAEMETIFRRELTDIDHVALRLEPAGSSASDRAGAVKSLENLVAVLLALPSGVQRMSTEIQGLVESSCNLAVCNRTGESVVITTSQRSSRNSRIDDMTRTIEAVARLSGAEFSTENSYPAWPPESNSSLLDRAKRVYRDCFDKDLRVEVIHAGLECAVIGSAIDDIEMISIGPTILGAHSPDERLLIPSIERFWVYLKALLL